jgi:GT2 family glycosyltransferase/SAM-dependent methyltransferase/glycosyltransferase involved in cell wall biosynthesis
MAMSAGRRVRSPLFGVREKPLVRDLVIGALDRLPPPLLVWARRFLKAVYWALTPHRIPARLAFLRERRELALAYERLAKTPESLAKDLAQAKARFRRQRTSDLAAFLRGSERLSLPRSDAPEVTIVLVLFNQAELTLHCLRSLLETRAPSEVVILDNASTDRTGELLDRMDGATVIRSPENLHFLRGVNRAAEVARGGAILLLNNDTWVEPGSIEAAWRRLAEEPDVGAVGGRIVLPNGTLQEAGSIIWNDGSCLGYGRGRRPHDPEFAFRRDVDYCSAAFLMVRREAFETLGRFDERFAPAYYEETDLCMRLRGAGLRVVYEPAVAVSHFEFGSAGTNGAMALQERNRERFVERHAEALAIDHRPSGDGPLEARMRDEGQGRILVIDDRLPVASFGSGLPRATDLLNALRDAGWFVTHYPLQFPEPESHAVARPELEVVYRRGVAGLPAFLAERSGYYDAVLISRPHNMEYFRRAMALAPEFAARTAVIYDAEAIFANREILKRRVLGLESDPARDAAEIAKELGLADGADVVLSVSETEAATFRDAATGVVRVLGHAIAADPTPAGFEARAGLLFVGALDSDDSPNVDSVAWFIDAVMPLIDARIGTDWRLTLAGRSEAPRLQAYDSPRVLRLGRVDDLRPLYDAAKALIAPTRFAAGIPMKAHEAAGAGLPLVVTGLLRDQLGWVEGEALAAGDTAEAFAEACVKVMTDAVAWRRLREGALAAVRADCDPAGFRSSVAALLEPLQGRRRGPAATRDWRHGEDLEKIRAAWAMSPEQRQLTYGLYWMGHPMVRDRLNIKASGAAKADAYVHLKSELAGQGWSFPVPRALSIGCGHGSLERGLYGLGVAERIDGIDIAPAAIAEARRLAAEEGLDNLHYQAGDLQRLDLPDGAYDIVFAHQSVHHIDDLDRVFAAVKRALRPGGIFHLHEFVGPDRFQWTDAQLEHMNAFLQTLPLRYRRLPAGGERGPQVRPTIRQMIDTDPSEAVRSSEIIPAVERHFRIVELKELGGALLHIGLSGIVQNFDTAFPADVERLEQFFALEDRLMAEGVIGSDFVTITAVRD